ncbi:MAG: hypothetical protein BWK76_17080 [Desulfobulbaceae bacterium A2]|nr:MAG: hypothetical protein BWK76_17080 [Desulfobulbaceae bacterium A2]
MNQQQTTPGFRSIRHRILIFSILVTLVPAFGMGWFWYDLTRKVTTEKSEQKLLDAAGIAEREINLWFKERKIDLRVFANSFVVLDNLRRSQQPGNSAAGRNPKERLGSPQQKIDTYLNLIASQFPEYRKLMVLDNEGRIFASSDSSDRERTIELPNNWQEQTSKAGYFTGNVYTLADTPSPLLLIGVPLLADQNTNLLGFFIIELRLRDLLPLLEASLPETGKAIGTIVLLRQNGRPLLSTDPGNGHSTSPPLLALFDHPRTLQEFVNAGQERLVGLAITFDDLPWGVVISKKHSEVFDSLFRARDRIMVGTGLLTILIGLTATLVARQIIIPLKKLTEGVLRVAGGDLDVTVAVRRNDELGIVSGMFNDMVRRLREDQQKLEQLATTDSLTGLANRKQIMTDLSQQMEHYRRYGTEFSILMLDIDLFKKINDTHGHLAGDEVLMTLARIFAESLRSLDRAGRYGGEEFLIILGKTEMQQAVQTAERIREAVERYDFRYGDVSLRLTISTGVTAINAGDTTIADLIGRADRALYEAKATGRNRVVQGDEDHLGDVGEVPTENGAAVT